jgi:hypothetical protein
MISMATEKCAMWAQFNTIIDADNLKLFFMQFANLGLLGNTATGFGITRGLLFV